jgi:hypothetical protein
MSDVEDSYLVYKLLCFDLNLYCIGRFNVTIS